MLAQVIDIGAVERLEQLHARQRATLGHLAPSIRAVLRLCLKTHDRDARRILALASVTLMELRRVPDREQWSVIDALIDRFEVVDDNDAALNDLGADMPHAKRLELAADGARRAR